MCVLEEPPSKKQKPDPEAVVSPRKPAATPVAGTDLKKDGKDSKDEKRDFETPVRPKQSDAEALLGFGGPGLSPPVMIRSQSESMSLFDLPKAMRAFNAGTSTRFLCPADGSLHSFTIWLLFF